MWIDKRCGLTDIQKDYVKAQMIDAVNDAVSQANDVNKLVTVAPVVSNRLSDIPNGAYFWSFGKRWKKVKSGKKYTKVIIEESWDNGLGVLTEQS